MRAVQYTVSSASAEIAIALRRSATPNSPRQTSTPRAATGTRLAIAATPSRESHELRHCDSARQARCGCPRWSTEDSRPTSTSSVASPTRTRANSRDSGSGARA